MEDTNEKESLAALLTVSMTAAMPAVCSQTISAGTAAKGSSAAGRKAQQLPRRQKRGHKPHRQKRRKAPVPIVTEPTELTFIFRRRDEGAKEVMNSVVEI